MAKITIKVEGFEKTVAKFNRFSSRQRKKLARIVTTSAFAIQAEAKKTVAIDTGRLRNSIIVRNFKQGMTADIGTNVFYAPFIEFGTRRTRPRPYLFSAFRKEEKNFLRKVKNTFRSVK